MKAKRNQKAVNRGRQRTNSPKSARFRHTRRVNIKNCKRRDNQQQQPMDYTMSDVLKVYIHDTIHQQLFQLLISDAGRMSLQSAAGGGTGKLQPLLEAVGQLSRQIDSMNAKLDLLGERMDTLEQGGTGAAAFFPFRIAEGKGTDFVKIVKAMLSLNYFDLKTNPCPSKPVQPNMVELMQALADIMDDAAMGKNYSTWHSNAVKRDRSTYLSTFIDLHDAAMNYHTALEQRRERKENTIRPVKKH